MISGTSASVASKPESGRSTISIAAGGDDVAVLVVAGTVVDVVVTAVVGAGAIVTVVVVSEELETHPAATSIATTSVGTILCIAHLQELPRGHAALHPASSHR